jgi:hypothetical protein
MAGVAGASSNSLTTPSAAETSSSTSPASTPLGDTLVPSDVTEDPSTQTLTTYADAVGDDPKTPPHTEESDVPAIIGATLGAVGIVILVFLLVFCYRRRQRRKEMRRRRPEVLPYKRDIDNEDGASSKIVHIRMRRNWLTPLDAHNANIAPGGARSYTRSHDRKSRSSSHNGSNHEMRSMYSVSVHNGQFAPSLSGKPTNLLANASHPPQNTSHSKGPSPACNDSVATAEQSKRASYVTDASLSDGDPAFWSRYSSINPCQGQADPRSPSRSPSRSPGRQTLTQGPLHLPLNDMKDDPYIGEARMSRATGSTFTPAQGATTAPTIKISEA